MTKEQLKVKEFLKTFDLFYSDKIRIPTIEVQTQRLNHIIEEFVELQDAVIANNFIALADAIADLLYVIYGIAEAYGIDIEPIFDEVHRSNMTKKDGFKDVSGKWIKPANYEPPRLKEILEAQGAKF